MGRLARKKRLLIEEANKRLIKEGDHKGLLYTSSSGSKYLLGRNGLAGGRLKKIVPELQQYLNSNGYSGTLSLDGVVRELNDAAMTNDPDRQGGSLHGAGLAIDIEFNIEGKKWGSIKDNKNLSTDTKLNKLIWNWVKSQGDILWGGEWGGSNPEEGIIKGRGVTEYHHFEIKSDEVSKYWQPYSTELTELGFGGSELNTPKQLLPLYQKLLEIK
jgi:hypothetical protein